jgi:hypothetical protein
VYGTLVTRRLRAMGIRDKPLAPGSPWQNGFAERLIGSIRRECVDHVVVLGEAHLRRILAKYAAYYNELRTHRSLGKDAPIHRAIQHVRRIASVPVLGGLHHHYLQNLIFGTDRGDVGSEEKIRFTSSILPKWARRTKSLDALLPVLGNVSSSNFAHSMPARA